MPAVNYVIRNRDLRTSGKRRRAFGYVGNLVENCLLCWSMSAGSAAQKTKGLSACKDPFVLKNTPSEYHFDSVQEMTPMGTEPLFSAIGLAVHLAGYLDTMRSNS